MTLKSENYTSKQNDGCQEELIVTLEHLRVLELALLL